jgi:hypothetical protein
VQSGLQVRSAALSAQVGHSVRGVVRDGAARRLAAQREQLEAANARYEKWTTDTSSRRDTAGSQGRTGSAECGHLN